MSELVTQEFIAEIKQFIVENLEYETGSIQFSTRNFYDDTAPSGVSYGEIAPFFSYDVMPLTEILNKREKSFSDELNELVGKSGLKPAEVYNRAQINRQLYSKISSDPDYKPKKLTALALAIALELTLEQTKEFIARAGYALTRSSVTDLVIEFFINRKMYNVMAINEVLEELDEPILGSVALEDSRGRLNATKSKAKAEARERDRKESQNV